MIDYKEELKYKKLRRDMIKSEINDLDTEIIVQSGRNNRFVVNNCRNRKNRLKMRLNELSLEIADLEKKINECAGGQIQLIRNNVQKVPSIKNGEICLTDTIEFDRGFDSPDGEIIETVERTYKKTITYIGGKPVSSKETVNERITKRRSSNENHYIATSVVG